MKNNYDNSDHGRVGWAGNNAKTTMNLQNTMFIENSAGKESPPFSVFKAF